MEDVLSRIIGIRKAKKVSQKEIAESLGISQAAYAKFESGNSITIDRLYKIAEFLVVPINEILDIRPTKLNEDLNVSLISEIELLRKQIEEKTLLIETLKNEKAHIKEHLVMQMVSGYSFDISLIKRVISNMKNINDKQAWLITETNIKRTFNINKDYYIKTGFLSQSDFENHYKEMNDLYENIPED